MEGTYKLNVDAAVVRTSGIIGFGGVIIWNSNGELMATFSKPVNLVSPATVELMAIGEDLHFFVPADFQTGELNSDSQVTI